MKHQQVLIIDDQPENLKVAVKLLEAYAFVVLTARDGETGLRRAIATHPDAVLLDVRMAGIDGYEVCKRLKTNPQTTAIPVIFMTALDRLEDKVRGFEVGGVDYVTKPLEPTELLARLSAHLEICRLRSSLEQQVTERTGALEREVAGREQLLTMVRDQSQQLRELTQAWLGKARARNQGFARELHEDVAARLQLMKIHLSQALEMISASAAGLDTRREAHDHLRNALELLKPAIESTESVGGSLERAASGSAEDGNPLLRLSTREYEVLQLLARGQSNKEIAAALGVAASTVSTYRTRIMEKLDVDTQTSLLKLAIRHRIVT